jgi:hypothetical protein
MSLKDPNVMNPSAASASLSCCPIRLFPPQLVGRSAFGGLSLAIPSDAAKQTMLGMGLRSWMDDGLTVLNQIMVKGLARRRRAGSREVTWS